MSPHSGKRPNPKKDKNVRRQRGAKTGTFTAGFLDPAARARLNRLTLQAADAPPESALAVTLTVLWTGVQSGNRAHHCVDACRTLGYALGETGVATELRATSVEVHDRRTGQGWQCAPLPPSWPSHDVLDGHCVLTIPDQRRYIDATIEQFPGLSALGAGPVVGRFGAALDPATGAMGPADQLPERPVPGTTVAVPRGDRVVLYTFGPDDANQIITGHPTITGFAAQHRRAGLNLLALVLGSFRGSILIDRLRETQLPRLHALMDTIGDAPLTHDEYQDARFTIDGRTLRLDEISLPSNAPPAVDPV